MKRPTVASLKKVTAANLASLGVDRLAEILAAAADARPELKRRLRMELAAAQGAEHLTPEIDKRLTSLTTSRGKVSWRQRPSFVKEVDGLRQLIAERLGGLDAVAALDRMWPFMATTRPIARRLRDRDGALAAVFMQAAGDIGALLAAAGTGATALARAMADDPALWSEWLPAIVEKGPPGLPQALLAHFPDGMSANPSLNVARRRLADAAGDVDAYRSTFTAAALREQTVAAGVAARLLAQDRIGEAGELLKATRPRPAPGRSLAPAPDFDWETAWIDYLERSGEAEAAQAARWSSFERTLSAERARAFTSRLADFEDIEAESRAFTLAAAHADAEKGLRFLMDWPALPEAARLIETRAAEVQAFGPDAELWAARLRARQPRAAAILLRNAAAAAARRRDPVTALRLNAEADTLED